MNNFVDISTECHCTPIDVMGNSFPVRCATPNCDLFTYGSHYPTCIMKYCSKCRADIAHQRTKAKKRKAILSKYKGYSRR